MEAPGASGCGPHLRLTPSPAIEQPPDCASINQLKPECSVSLIVALEAVPVPAALEFVSVIVKPIESPLVIVPASAVFLSVRLGHCTTMSAAALLSSPIFVGSSLTALTFALLCSVLQLLNVVGA